MDGIVVWETGGSLLRCGFLTKDSEPLTVEINHVSLDRTIEVYRLRLGGNLKVREFYRSSRSVVNGLQEIYC